MRPSPRSGVLISARAKRIYVGVTIAYMLVAAGFAAAGVWVVAVALLAMGGAMTGASLQMRTPDRAARPKGREGSGGGARSR